MVMKAVFQTSSGAIHICSYASVMSSFEQNLALATSLQVMSWSGKGVKSLTVLSFLSLASTTVVQQQGCHTPQGLRQGEGEEDVLLYLAGGYNQAKD